MVQVKLPREIIVGDTVSLECGHSVVDCPHICRVLFTPRGSGNESFKHTWNECRLDSGHCDFHGRRFKFRSCWTHLKVVWVCPKILSLSNLANVDCASNV